MSSAGIDKDSPVACKRGGLYQFPYGERRERGNPQDFRAWHCGAGREAAEIVLDIRRTP